MPDEKCNGQSFPKHMFMGEPGVDIPPFPTKEQLEEIIPKVDKVFTGGKMIIFGTAGEINNNNNYQDLWDSK